VRRWLKVCILSHPGTRTPSFTKPAVAQFHLVECAAAVVEAGAAALAAVLGDTDEGIVLLIEHHAVIGGCAVFIRARAWISCTESVQNLEGTNRPDAVNDTVAVHPAVVADAPALRGGCRGIRGDQVRGEVLSEKVVWQMLRPYAVAAGVPGIAPHDARRSSEHVSIGKFFQGVALQQFD